MITLVRYQRYRTLAVTTNSFKAIDGTWVGLDGTEIGVYTCTNSGHFNLRCFTGSFEKTSAYSNFWADEPNELLNKNHATVNGNSWWRDAEKTEVHVPICFKRLILST